MKIQPVSMSRRVLYFAIPASLVTLTILYLNFSTDLITLVPSALLAPVRLEPPLLISQADDRHLTENECLRRYPALYHEADRAEAWYTARGGITEDMVDKAEQDGGHARLVILDNKLFVKAFNGGINSRTQAAIAAVYATLLTSPEPLPDIDFVIQTGDAGSGEHPHFVLDRKADQDNLWLMPDFGFYSWPEPGVGAYVDVRRQTLEYEENLGLAFNGFDILSDSWGGKIKKLMWRGAPMVEIRQDLLRASSGQEWSDVKELNWGAVNQDEDGREANNGDLKSPAEHCEYGFLAHVEGWAYSGRLKYLQQCRSVVVTHPLEFIQHYHHLLNGVDGHPDQNIVIVPTPLEQHLPGVMEDLLSEAAENKIQRILDNSWKFMRQGYISPAANECYYRHALRAYARVQRFTPSIDRGVAYESFVLTGSTHWDPHR